MLKNKITIGLLTAAIANPIFAANFISKIQKRTLAPNATANNHSSEKYTDFSGEWTGTCAYSDGNSNESSLTVKNDGINITINEEDYSIGTLRSDTDSDKWLTDTNSIMFIWNQEMTSLKFQDISVTTTHPDYPYTEKNQHINTYLGEGSISFENKQLILKTREIAAFENGIQNQEDNFNTICRFDRVK